MTSVLQRMNGAHKTGIDKVAHGCGIQKNIHSIFSVATKGEAMNIVWKRQFGNKRSVGRGKKDLGLEMCLILRGLVSRLVPFFAVKIIHFQHNII